MKLQTSIAVMALLDSAFARTVLTQIHSRDPAAAAVATTDDTVSADPVIINAAAASPVVEEAKHLDVLEVMGGDGVQGKSSLGDALNCFCDK